MEHIEGLPAITITYRKSGQAKDSQHARKLREFIKTADIDDLLVISHGWNNSKAEAFKLYRELLKNFKAARSNNAKLANKKIGVLAIVWPSKRFKAFEKAEVDGFAGGASSIPMPQIFDPMDDVDTLLDELDDDLSLNEQDSLRGAAEAAIEDANHWPIFLKTLKEVLPFDPDGGGEVDEVLDNAIKDPQDALVQLNHIHAVGADGAFVGGAAGGSIGGAAGAVGSLLNFTTFYTMKRRAGDVGKHGVARSIVGLRKARTDLRIHFVGHSFGARVVSMAALSLNGHPLSAPNSMTLLQAAFSHNSFSAKFPPNQKTGFFRNVMSRSCVKGPILVTHTFNDSANRVAYSIASSLSGQNASFNNAEPSQYGALGANGAQHMKSEVSEGKLLASGASGYAFGPGKIFNLESSSFIGGHSDVKGPEVAYALVKAIASNI